MKFKDNITIIFETNKKIFFKREVTNKPGVFHYYVAKKHGNKICKKRYISEKQFNFELNLFLAELDSKFNKFETEKFNSLEQMGVH